MRARAHTHTPVAGLRSVVVGADVVLRAGIAPSVGASAHACVCARARETRRPHTHTPHTCVRTRTHTACGRQLCVPHARSAAPPAERSVRAESFGPCSEQRAGVPRQACGGRPQAGRPAKFRCSEILAKSLISHLGVRPVWPGRAPKGAAPASSLIFGEAENCRGPDKTEGPRKLLRNELFGP